LRVQIYRMVEVSFPPERLASAILQQKKVRSSMHPDARPSPEELSKIEARLRNELESAQTAYHEAKITSVKANRIVEDLGLNHPDGNAARRNTTRSERQAFQRYADALRAFNDFVLYYKLPKKLPEE
jgi:hypothetical protein